MIIGIVGGACSGKDTVADLLVECFKFERISTSKIVRAELEAKGLDGTRQMQRIFANKRRQKMGGNYFVREALSDARQRFGDNDLVISDLYCVNEIKYLKNEGGIIIAVLCSDIQRRYERMCTRKDGRRDELTLTNFHKVIKDENSGLTDDEPNVENVCAMADYKLENSDTLESLKLKIFELVKTIPESLAKNPFEPLPKIFRGLDSRKDSESTILNLDSFDELKELETKMRALEFLTNFHANPEMTDKERALSALFQPTHTVKSISNQFAYRLLPAYFESDSTKALELYESIEPYTIDEELALLLNQNEFKSLHKKMSEHLQKIAPEIESAVRNSSEQIKINDRLQFDTTATESLENVKSRGLTIRLNLDHVKSLEIAQGRVRNGRIPVIEIIKRDRIIESGGQANSKVSLAVHDLMDHIWFFTKLEEHGVLDKHKSLFTSIGNPHLTNIYKREGEIAASIAFGVRAWSRAGLGFVPNFSLDEIKAIFEQAFDTDSLSAVGISTLRDLRKICLRPKSRNYQCISFVFSNYLAELDEQRRKHGKIKVRNGKNQLSGELNPWGHEFLSFFIDAMNLILDSHTKHRDTLLRAHISLEEFFASKAALQGQSLEITPQFLEKMDVTEISIPPERIEWMSQNYGFTAVRDSIS